jgi:hypothetical protein
VGSFLEPQLGFSSHRLDGEGFVSSVAEAMVDSRLDPQELLPDVREPDSDFLLDAGELTEHGSAEELERFQAEPSHSSQRVVAKQHRTRSRALRCNTFSAHT